MIGCRVAWIFLRMPKLPHASQRNLNGQENTRYAFTRPILVTARQLCVRAERGDDKIDLKEIYIASV
jgi:hypothetical protein